MLGGLTGASKLLDAKGILYNLRTKVSFAMVVPAELMTTCLGGRASQTCMHDRRSRFHGFHAITSEALIKCP